MADGSKHYDKLAECQGTFKCHQDARNLCVLERGGGGHVALNNTFVGAHM